MSKKKMRKEKEKTTYDFSNMQRKLYDMPGIFPMHKSIFFPKQILNIWFVNYLFHLNSMS